MIIETHAHLDDKRFDADLDEVIKRAFDGGIKAIIIPGADINDLPKAVKICENYENIYFTVGVHPYHAKDYDEATLLKFAKHKKCIGVGECGLDYYRLPEDENEKIEEKNLQKDVFRKHIKIAKKLKKPLIVHIREASKDSRDILIEENAKEVGGVLHCFNASELLLDLYEHDFYFGIGGVITFKNAKKLVKILPKIPIDRLVVETDAPYLTPHPYRGERNEPLYTTFVIKKIAEILAKTEEEVKNIVFENSKNLFKEFNKL